MRQVNHVFLQGNVGKDPEISIIEGTNISVAKFSLATNEGWKDRESNEFKEHTEWHNIVVKGIMVENIVKPMIKKGSLIFLIGRIRTRSWKTDDQQTKYITEILASQIGILHKNNSLAEDSIPF